MSEYEHEPVPGLPGRLPPGEQMLWQGAPDWRVLARTAFHTRGVAIYFALLVGVALLGGSPVGAAMTAALGLVSVGMLHLIAWGSARTTLYTLTNRRLVFRIGIAVPKCINLPLGMIDAVDLALRPDGTGDLPLTLKGAPRLGYLALWPHARPLRMTRPQPMLRAVPDGETVAALVARTCLAANPAGRLSPVETPVASLGTLEAQAA